MKPQTVRIEAPGRVVGGLNRALWKRSPNAHARPAATVVDLLVAHASPNLRATKAWCLDPAAKVTYHDIISEAGVLYPIVEYDRAAWANGGKGRSAFAGPPASDGTNSRSISFCLVNAQNGRSPIPAVQFEVAAAVAARACRMLGTIRWITEHSRIALPVGRKADIAPAEPTFDLDAFAARVNFYIGTAAPLIRVA